MPSARPGDRAPHVWLEHEGVRISTIDVFGPRFTLLAGRRGTAWRDAARAVASPARPEIAAYVMGADLVEVDGAWSNAYEVDDDGAVLVRPDGHVAWRSRVGSDRPERTLEQVLERVLARPAATRA